MKRTMVEEQECEDTQKSDAEESEDVEGEKGAEDVKKATVRMWIAR